MDWLSRHHVLLDYVLWEIHFSEVKFSIELVSRTRSISIAPYRVSPTERADLEQQVEGLSTKRLVRPSVSSWEAPVLLVRKKGGKSRSCVDFRQLNKVAIKNKSPLPRIDGPNGQLSEVAIFPRSTWSQDIVKSE